MLFDFETSTLTGAMEKVNIDEHEKAEKNVRGEKENEAEDLSLTSKRFRKWFFENPSKNWRQIFVH